MDSASWRHYYKVPESTESYEIASDDAEDNETSEPEPSTPYDQDYFPTSDSKPHFTTQSYLKKT